MVAFRDASIRNKLTLILVLTGSVTLLVACAAFIAYDVRVFRRSMVDNLSTLAEIVGTNSTAALAFEDAKSAEEILAALRAERHVMSAQLRRRDGTLFATYARPNAPAPLTMPPMASTGARFSTGRLHVWRHIVLDGETIGATTIEADLDEMRERLLGYAGIVALVAVIATAITLFLASRSQRVISEPVLELARVARTVSDNKDYSVRGRKRGDDEIGQLIDGFNDMLGQIQHRDEALQAANKELESFSYSVSHDLRVPLRAIHGLCRVLDEEHAAGLAPEGRRLFGLMRTSAQRMSELLDDLLEFSRLGRKALETQSIDMTALVRTVVDELVALESTRQIDVRVEPLPPAVGDPILVHQVFVNLITNALKFTRETPMASIRISGETADGTSLYAVRDNGVGFDMRYAHKLFRVFQRLHSTQVFEGTGVGLAIAARIVQRHDGRIWAEARPNEGATFFFTLPTPR